MVDLKIKGTGIETKAPNTGGLPVNAGTRNEGPQFAGMVKGARRQVVDGELKSLLEQTRTIGERFLKSPDETKLNTYKSALKDYLNRASKELFSLKQEFGASHQGQQKVYQLVETIDREVDTLTRETLQQDKALQLLGSLDEIRGLILDLIT
jgi:hypothetical protein